MRKFVSVARELLLVILSLVIALCLFLLGNERILNNLPLYFAIITLLGAIALYYFRKNAVALSQDLHMRLFHIAVIFFLLLGLEKYLRNSGYSPGSYYKEFRLTEKLVDYSFQYSDKTGIMRIDRNSKYLPPYYNHINDDGFRSKYEFDSLSISALKKKGKKIIMFIGDSFTEGSSAIPRDSCFVDLIDANPNYSTLNFGMYGTDPLQYEMVAAQYAATIKPDAVVVVTYRNDLMQYDRKPTPGVPLYFSSSAYTGDLWEAQKPLELGFKPGNVLKTKEEAYEFYKTFCAIPLNHYWGWLCSKSCITTLLWGKVKQNMPSLPPKVIRNDLPYAYNHLKTIQKLCDSIQTPVLFFHIPEVYEFSKSKAEIINYYKPTFKDIRVHYISDLTVRDHVGVKGDTHFNNCGHAKFAAFVTGILDSLFAEKD
jgi:hypothetical protein